jgi:hypothetical protein
VKARFTMVLSRTCRGSSRVIIEPKNSATSGATSVSVVLVGLELKTSG